MSISSSGPSTKLTGAWPKTVPLEIALAARIVMLSAASRTCPLDGRTEDQDMLLDLIRLGTRPMHVEGQSFSEFLSSAVAHLEKLVKTEISDVGAVEETLVDIQACKPQDIVGATYTRLAELASEVYAPILDEPLAVPLKRTILERAPKDHPFHVTGQVPGSRKIVMLNLYAAGFDLRSLALVPRILAHELVCHVAARHTGMWAETPIPDFRAFFSDGFMDCAAWQLLLMWLEDGELLEATPVGHLTESDIPYAYKRPEAFSAARGAWGNCHKATGTRLADEKSGDPADMARRRAYREGNVITAALRLNACAYHIEPKDRFVHLARKSRSLAIERFADVAIGNATAPELLGEIL
jgi:hypothetical protein